MSKSHLYTSYSKLRHSREGALFLGVVYGVIAYIFASLAIDSGSYWYYAVGIAAIWAATDSLIRAAKHHVNR